MLDFAVLPPEVNSARMYAGAGSASLVAAAAAWDRLAGSLASAEQSCRVVLEELTDGSWQGSSAAAMTGAAQPYLAWLSGTAVQAAQTAEQARGAVAAYEAAFSATVPPAVIGANRSALAVLVRTNVFGQNTAAIAANQADYAQMWAQDAAAMHSYAASAAAVAPQPGAFTAPPQTTNPSAAGSQTATTAPAAGGDALANLLNNNPLVNVMNSDPVTATETLMGGLSSYTGVFLQQAELTPSLWALDAGLPVIAAISASQAFAGATGAIPAFAASAVSEGADKFVLAGAAGAVGGADVSAGMGRATTLGGLSVPGSWGAAAAPGIRLATAAAPGVAGWAGASGMAGAGGWLGGIPPVGGVVNAPRTAAPGARGAAGVAVLTKTATTDGDANRGHRSAGAGRSAVAERRITSARDELDQLRREAAELTKEREVLERSADSLLRLADKYSRSPRR